MGRYKRRSLLPGADPGSVPVPGALWQPLAERVEDEGHVLAALLDDVEDEHLAGRVSPCVCLVRGEVVGVHDPALTMEAVELAPQVAARAQLACHRGEHAPDEPPQRQGTQDDGCARRLEPGVRAGGDGKVRKAVCELRSGGDQNPADEARDARRRARAKRGAEVFAHRVVAACMSGHASEDTEPL